MWRKLFFLCWCPWFSGFPRISYGLRRYIIHKEPIFTLNFWRTRKKEHSASVDPVVCQFHPPYCQFHSRLWNWFVTWAIMDEIQRLFGTMGRVRSDSMASTATLSTGSRLLLRQRLTQLMTCVDDLDPSDKLHDQVARTLDNAFLICGKKAGRTKKDNFRWRQSREISHLLSVYISMTLRFSSVTFVL